MKITLTVFFFSFLLYANTFETRKQTILDHINNKLTHFEEAKKCVESATDDALLTKCHQSMREKNIELRTEAINKRIQKLEERKNRLMKGGS